ncbi:MAG: isochorismatase family protein, partial [Planctomycetes bacterium]|nr:isochorismatase family protein [Planctomycetota bacterium]
MMSGFIRPGWSPVAVVPPAECCRSMRPTLRPLNVSPIMGCRALPAPLFSPHTPSTPSRVMMKSRRRRASRSKVSLPAPKDPIQEWFITRTELPGWAVGADVPPPTFRLVLIQLLTLYAHPLEMPVAITEQVPAKLGKTVPAIVQAAGKVTPTSKSTFSAVEAGKALGKKRVLVAGCEAHVCVRQTVYDLRQKEVQPVLVADATGSRQEADRQLAL